MRRQKAKERLEREAHDAVADFGLEDAVELLREALTIRETSQGKAHPDLIWTLSPWIEVPRQKHRPERALEAAGFGEQQRSAFAGLCNFRERPAAA